MPLSEDEDFSQGLEYENYELPNGPEFPPDSLSRYRPRGYVPVPPQIGDGRDYRPPEREPFLPRDSLPRRPPYDSRQLRSGTAYRRQSSPNRRRYQTQSRQLGQGYSTRSIQTHVPDREADQPWRRYQLREPVRAAPEFRSPSVPLLVSSNEEYD
eukprot:g20425.t1